MQIKAILDTTSRMDRVVCRVLKAIEILWEKITVNQQIRLTMKSNGMHV